MAFIKCTIITSHDCKVTRRSGHWTNPEVLTRLNTKRVTYCVIDTNGRGRGGSSCINDITGKTQSELKQIANKA